MVAVLDFGLLLRATSRGGTLDEMTAINDRILAACAEHQLAVWIVDHLQFDDLPLLECTTFLAHTAGRYPGLRYGSIVLGQGFRNPAMIAKIGATLQHLTGGRFILGIGAGWKEDEYRAYGYPYPAAGTRIEELDEAVQIIRTLWTTGPASFTGKHYTIADAYCSPRPDPSPILMIGGAGEKRTLRVVAQYADWWNADYYSPADYARKLAVLHEHCRAIGRDPSEITPTYYGAVRLSRKPDPTVNMPLSHRSDLFTLSGTPEQVTEQLEQFAALGVRHVQLSFIDFPRTEGLELFLSEVLPRFARPDPPA